MDNFYLQVGFDFLHLLATITWFGALFTNFVIVMPVASKVLPKEHLQAFMGNLMKRNKLVVYISLSVLFITGIPMKISSEYYVSIINFSNEWQTLLFAKHILVAILAILAIYNFEVIIPKIRKMAMAGNESKVLRIKKLQAATGKSSFILAFLIILLSALMNYL